MIKRIEKLPLGLPENVVTCRINALCKAFGGSVGVDIFSQTVNGKLTAVFGGMDGSFSALVFDDADIEELNAYFSFLGVTVFCLDDTAEKLQRSDCEISDLYELKTQAEMTDSDGHGRISDVYSALKKGEDGDIALPPFDPWYADFCVRFNHQAAEYALTDGAVAVAGFVTGQNALITGVATDAAFRKTGRGAEALKTLLSNIRKKHANCRVFAATKNAGGFYIKNGFKSIGKVAVCRF